MRCTKRNKYLELTGDSLKLGNSINEINNYLAEGSWETKPNNILRVAMKGMQSGRKISGEIVFTQNVIKKTHFI